MSARSVAGDGSQSFGALARHLLRHELRLRWRGLVDFLTREGGDRDRRLMIWLAVIVIGAHLAFWPIVSWAGAKPVTSATMAVTLAVVFSLLFAAALDTVTYALYARGDYDLLFSSPALPHHIFLVRALGVVAATVMQIGLYAAPYVNVKALLHGPQWLLAYPVGLALVLFAVAAAITVSLLLVATVGIRFTRIAAQLCAALTGLSLFLLYRSGAADQEMLASAAQLFGPAARAMLGDVTSLAAVLLSAVATAALVGFALARPFVETITRAASTAQEPEQRRSRRAFRFATVWPRVIVRKEHRLILRDPWLLSQLAMQSLYLLPVAVVLIARIPSEPQSILILPAIVAVFAGQAAGSLAWIALSAEEARELLAVAPVTERSLVRSKIVAVGELVALVVGPMALAIACFSLQAGIATAIGAAAAAAAAVLINLWYANVARKHDFMRRRATSSPLINALETGVLILIGITTALAAQLSVVAILGAAIVGGLMLALRRLRPARSLAA